MQVNMISVDQYLRIICALLIDQYNDKYRDCTDKRRLLEATSGKYFESDWTHKIGEYFKELAHFEARNENKRQGHHDIKIPSKGFTIEVKYPQNWNDSHKLKNNKMPWTQFKKDFNWLAEEIVKGNKGKSAFVMLWFNSVDYFGRIMQIGEKSGSHPYADFEKLRYFPFLTSSGTHGEKIYAKDLKYNYLIQDSCKIDLDLNVNSSADMECLFLGSEGDRLHAAIYY